MAKNLTISFPDELYEKMSKFNDVNWSAVARNAIEDYLERRTEPDLEPILEKLTKEKGDEYSKGVKKATEIYKKENYAKLDELFSEYYKRCENNDHAVEVQGESGLSRDDILLEVLKSKRFLNVVAHFTGEFKRGLYESLMRFKKASKM